MAYNLLGLFRGHARGERHSSMKVRDFFTQNVVVFRRVFIFLIDEA